MKKFFVACLSCISCIACLLFILISASQAWAESTSAAPAASQATSQTTSQTQTTVLSSYSNAKDPYEKFNRAMFGFNEIFDKYFFKPLAILYNKIMPKPLNKGVSNVFNNIDTLPTVVNDLLQANFYQATSDAWRLGINTTIGIGGLFDVATDMGLDPNTEDFGLTLAQWGYRNSNYLVLPFFGPSSPRDMVGLWIDYDFFSIYPHIHPTRTRYAIYLFGALNRRAQLVKYEDVMEEAAMDKYVFMRDAYMQRRAYLIQRNQELSNPYLEENDQGQNN